MAKLTKAEARKHAAACERLESSTLTMENREFIFNNWHEAATHINGVAGAFFTPLMLANDFKLEIPGRRILDLCAGIGALSFPHFHWNDWHDERRAEVTCIEINPAYVEVGRKVFPEANWICGDALDPDTYIQALDEHGPFDVVVSNPPFGKVGTTGAAKLHYSGAEFHYRIIDLAASLGDYGAFIIPQMAAPFRFSGNRGGEYVENERYEKFNRQTGIELAPGCGIDCAFHADDWKFSPPSVERVCCDFTEITRPTPRTHRRTPILTDHSQQQDLFG
jgi:16S rRNA G966 N2-methylase RsmD